MRVTRCLSCKAIVTVSDGKCPKCGSTNLHDNRRALRFGSGCGWFMISSCSVLAVAEFLIIEPIRRTQGWPESKVALDLSAAAAILVGLVAFACRWFRRDSALP